MVSRLDRLFILLDTGSNESVRLAAAKQLGEVQRVQSQDLGVLLDRIKEYSCKPSWETRIAAGHAIRYVLENVPTWPDPQIKLEKDDDNKQQIARGIIESCRSAEKVLIEFDLDDIVNNCPILLSANRAISDDLDASTSLRLGKARNRKAPLPGRKQNKDQLQRQRQLISKELGMGMVDSLGMGVKSTDIVSNDDLQVEEYSSESCDTAPRSSATHLVQGKISNYIEVFEKSSQIFEVSKTGVNGPTQWPLTDIVEHFGQGLFDASWETRHGAAISLREIVKSHGRCAGKLADFHPDINDKLNELWLVDMTLKAICVLGLDRFGDFLFDQVVAPVRENAAQLLGCCVAVLPQNCVSRIIGILIKMLGSVHWETRHGGLLGLKYSLSVLDSQNLRTTTRRVFDTIFKCLADANDDVSAEAAATLVLIKDILLETIPDKTPTLIKFLWEHLAELDELSSSTSNIILLLASLLSASSGPLDPGELKKFIPRLWPLLNHPSTTVRISVLKALITLSKFEKRPCLLWMPDDLMAVALRLIFQRSVIENMDEVHPNIEDAWKQLTSLGSSETCRAEARTALLRCTSQYLNYWFCLTMQPSNSPIDRGYHLWLNIRPDGTISDTRPEGEIYIGTSTFDAETPEQKKTRITKCRLLGAHLLGVLYSNLTDDPGKLQYSQETLKYLSDMFVHYLAMKSANQRMISAWALESWASHQSQFAHSDRTNSNFQLPEAVLAQLRTAISETTLCYDELASDFTRIQQEAREFVAALRSANIESNFPTATDKRVFYNLSQIQTMCDMNLEAELTRAASKRQLVSKPLEHEPRGGTLFTSLAQKKSILSRSNQTTRATLKTLSITTLSSLACALVAWDSVLEQLKLVFDPLLDSIEFETDNLLQEKSSYYLVRLLDILCTPPDKSQEIVLAILDRLFAIMHKCSMTPLAGDPSSATTSVGLAPNDAQLSREHRVILLDSLQRQAVQRSASRRQSSVSATATLKRSLSQASTADENDHESLDIDIRSHLDMKTTGARRTFGRVIGHFGRDLPTRLPSLWQVISHNIEAEIDAHLPETQGATSRDDNLLRDLIVLQVVCENLEKSLLDHLLPLPEHLVRLLSSSSAMIRHQAGQCIGAIAKVMFNASEPIIRHKIIPMLDSTCVVSRLGAIEAIALIIEHLQLDLVPRINNFVVHVLRRMGDQNEQVRLMATHCFGKLLSLMPLNFQGYQEKLATAGTKSDIDDDSHFIEQLLDPKKIKNHKLQFGTRARLRSYQQEGLNWLAFLNRFNLHGILCDEMGLGKTFMTICMVASDHFNSMTAKEQHRRKSASLIVCPPTLIEHWLFEIEKFVPGKTISALNPVGYRSASQAKRQSIRSHLAEALLGEDGKGSDTKSPINLVVTSYDVLRNDVDSFKSISWNYCVLDEGHIIKNGRTKLSRAIRQIEAKHRLILSGTPIQNNVTELWSLFDFLMPGFLGSERQFNSRYARPILQSREPKCSAREQEAGALAMESLHRQVLPFILRRLKADVLNDLPPKILQDYYCELSPLQAKLYEDFKRDKLCKNVTKRSLIQLSEGEDLSLDANSSSKSHVFQALQYLKSVCNHPKLVMSQKHSQYAEIKRYLEAEGSSLDDVCHSSKLIALQQLLIDCGIGLNDESQQPHQKASLGLKSIVHQHRALIFCQLKSMVEIIENDLFKKHLPNITYLRLDGTVPTNQRQAIVTRFNNDPSIDVLLLTTHIGGLGLNLTGADTVIFVEHDWNPTRDLQAMDRAHRIGQKKVVNVYRLITKNTLEERIMGLQKFKTMVSNTVINQDNTGLATMNVDQLFDLFDSGSAAANSNESKEKSTGDGGAASVTDLLPDLWDQQQYETEYDLDNFVASLKG